MTTPDVPDIVVSRLPLYLRTLKQLAAQGRTVTSSQELGDLLGMSSAQIRKDLSRFGEFGKQGTGYAIAYLVEQLEHILHVDRLWDMILVGAGDLGHALVNYRGFEPKGFRIAAVYDKDPQKIGREMGSLIVEDVRHMPEQVRTHGWHIGILAVPTSEAKSVANAMVDAGIRAILCYAPTILSLPSNVWVQYIDPIVHLQHMTYYLGNENP